TWVLLDMAWQALAERRKVLFFEIGDLTKNQILKRFAVRAARRPLRKRKVKFPTSLEVVGDEGDVKFEERVFDSDLNLKEAKKGFLRAKEHRIKSKGTYLKLRCYPAGMLSVAKMKSDIRQLKRENGWEPDVVIVDYADLLQPPPGVKESRDKP